MPTPIDLHGVHRLCETVDFLYDFISSLASIMEPINILNRKQVEFTWDEPQHKAFDKIKTILTSECHLQYYDEEKHLIVQCDASQRGLGAALLQERKPIAHARRALTNTEANYMPRLKRNFWLFFLPWKSSITTLLLVMSLFSQTTNHLRPSSQDHSGNLRNDCRQWNSVYRSVT